MNFRQPEISRARASTRAPASHKHQFHRSPIRFDPRRLVQYGGPAAQHLAARVLHLVGDVIKRSYYHQFGHGAGQQARGAGPVHQGQGHSIALPRRQPSLAETNGRRRTSRSRATWIRPVAVEIIVEFKDWGQDSSPHRGRRMTPRPDHRSFAAAPQLPAAAARRCPDHRAHLVALATILATKLTFDGFLERRRTMGVLAAEQSLHFGHGRRSAGQPMRWCKIGKRAPSQTTLAAPWAQPTQPFPITPQDDPEAEPIGPARLKWKTCRGASI
jgi:hypothetical protein